MLNGYTSASNQIGNTIRIAFAGTEPLSYSGELFTVELVALDGAGVSGLSSAAITHVLHNESSGATRIVNGHTVAKTAPRSLTNGVNSIYPNPIVSSATIEFAVSAKQPVKIAIYDLAGREVRRLIDANKEAGAYRVTWDCRDSRGQAVSAQTYLLRFATRGYTKTSRLYVIR
jgi:hypothetical protein